jgi:hypothetical protein
VTFRSGILSLLFVASEREEQDTQLACLGSAEVSSLAHRFQEGLERTAEEGKPERKLLCPSVDLWRQWRGQERL